MKLRTDLIENKFTIQNVSIKLFKTEMIEKIIRNLQYKMFLLNKISSNVTVCKYSYLQYKMFLLNFVSSSE